MSNATPSRPGQANLAGNPRALFLSVFGGRVLEAYDRQSYFRNRHYVRTIPEGQSARFPVTGRTTAYIHTPGAEINGELIRGNERLINIEDMIVAPVFVASQDELQNHFDYQGIVARQIGQALARRYDQNVGRTAIAGSRSARVIDDGEDGFQIEDANLATDGGAIWQALFNAGVRLDQIDAPVMERHGVFRPVQYALLVRSEKPLDRNLGNEGNGSLAKGVIYEVNGIGIDKTNNLPSTDDRAAQDQPTFRRLDYRPTVGLVFTEDAVGTLQLQDITMESGYDMRRQGDLMIGKYMVGHGVLRPESAIELRTGAPST